MKSKIVLSCLVLQMSIMACQKETIPIAMDIDCGTVTYSNTIEPMVRASCGGSSCHGNGASNGEMLTYNSLKPYVDNGTFRREVLDAQTMPEGFNLTSEELGEIKCWLDSGALDN